MNDTLSGFVSIVGRPNVGKSTILNRLIGEKISIVSDKPQTTRTNIIGIYTENNAQIVFIDTPGIQSPKNKLGEFMSKEADNSVKDTDLIICVTDTSNYIGKKDKKIISDLEQIKNIPKILVINKIDTILRENVLPLIKMYNDTKIFEEIIPLSAKTGSNMQELINVIIPYLKNEPWYYPDDAITDAPIKSIVSEIIREKVLMYTTEEIPHGIMVIINSMHRRKDNVTDIAAIIYCEKESHKSILIGKGAHKIKGIGMSARKDIETLIQTPVNLKLVVRVKHNWRDNERLIKNFGFDKKEF